MNKKQQATKNVEKKELNPTRGGKKQSKGIHQQNILQTMRNEIDLLGMFTQMEINYLFENYDIIVFERSMVLVKQNQIVDFVGVILNGGAIAQKSKTKLKKNSIIGHGVSLFGFQNLKHPESIIAESEGILFSIRIETLLIPSKNELQNSVKSKILKFMAQQTLFELKGQREFKSSLESEFEGVDEKTSIKFQQSNKLYSSLLECLCDPKDKQKFIEQFPVFCAKEKTLIASKHSKPYFLILLKGEIVIKYGLGVRKQSRTIEVNSLYNSQGFIFDHNQFSNLYCSSHEAVFLIVDKQRFLNNFKLLSFAGIFKYLLDYTQKTNDYSLKSFLPQSSSSETNPNNQIWSPFKKSYQIQELPAKNTSKTQVKSLTNKKKDSINAFQTLYQNYSNTSKNKLKSKQTQITENVDLGLQKAKVQNLKGSLKTEYSTDEKNSGNLVNEKLKKLEMEILKFKEQNQSLTQTIRKFKLDLLESQSKLKMIEVFREIRNSHRFKEDESFSQKISGKTENAAITLKEAFLSHLKNKKLGLLVAKCAFKWLSITRQNKIKRANQSSSSFLSKSMQGPVN